MVFGRSRKTLRAAERPLSVIHVNDIAFVGSTLVRGLRQAGVDARLIEPWRPGAAVVYPWKAPFVPLRIAALGRTAIALRRARPDLIHVHYARLGLLGPGSGRPFVLHCHGTDVRGIRTDSAWGRLIQPAMRAASAVLYATPDLAPDVHRFRDDATFLPNPIPAIAPSPPVTERMRDVLVGVRLDPLKGATLIAEIVRRLALVRPATTFTIIAHGSQVDIVRSAAGGNGQLISPLDHSSMPALFGRHRLAIGQMRIGAVGNYELEALAAGLPTAASFRFPGAYPGPPPLVDDDDPARVADRLARLLDDDRQRESLGRAGRDWVEAEHGPEVVVRRLLMVYASIMSRNDPWR